SQDAAAIDEVFCDMADLGHMGVRRDVIAIRQNKTRKSARMLFENRSKLREFHPASIFLLRNIVKSLRTPEATLISQRELTGHLPAFLGAFAAGCGAILAMLRLVFLALGGTGIAHFRAERAEPGRELAASRHEPGGERAKIRAIAIQFDATRHFLHILLVQACRRAVFARCRALVTRVDTALVFFVWHMFSSLLVYFLISPHVAISLP